MRPVGAHWNGRVRAFAANPMRPSNLSGLPRQSLLAVPGHAGAPRPAPPGALLRSPSTRAPSAPSASAPSASAPLDDEVVGARPAASTTRAAPSTLTGRAILREPAPGRRPGKIAANAGVPGFGTVIPGARTCLEEIEILKTKIAAASSNERSGFAAQLKQWQEILSAKLDIEVLRKQQDEAAHRVDATARAEAAEVAAEARCRIARAEERVSAAVEALRKQQDAMEVRLDGLPEKVDMLFNFLEPRMRHILVAGEREEEDELRRAVEHFPGGRFGWCDDDYSPYSPVCDTWYEDNMEKGVEKGDVAFIDAANEYARTGASGICGDQICDTTWTLEVETPHAGKAKKTEPEAFEKEEPLSPLSACSSNRSSGSRRKFRVPRMSRIFS